ncbi:2-hydroxyglutarate dehydrogenase [Dendrobium catenatum]|uniref:L-2-hydroxyglutarate dehydrogenase, mitochondrial n=2 Tax=Dendrobium catenatum TaxID=906689 RepID=A0A2I0W388_9ASPA|nr:2-hydroxyglutarate dehydrogenase [Dendrobium catenatum]
MKPKSIFSTSSTEDNETARNREHKPMLSKAFRKAGEFATATANAIARRNLVSSGGGVSTETADVVVIGAGVVGLAVAREFALKGRDVLVVEAATTFGTGTSSRNSEVIHAGIYYPPQSLKAVLCVRGRELLYKYCSDRGIPHKQLGKLIVATRVSEISKLEQILKRGIENGVEDLRMAEGSLAMEMEPELHCVKALLSPSSGIVDSHAFMLSLVGDAENFGTTISYNTIVIGGQVEDNSLHLQVSESKDLENHAGESTTQPQLVIIPKIVINSAGLSALHLAKRFQGLNHRFIPASYFARGCYFTLSNTKSPFSHLIYPIPEDGGLGVHVTLDLNGQVKFGPDVEWIDDVDDISSFLNRLDYSVNAERSSRFYPEIRKYFPNLRDGSLEPGYSGIRPKLSGRGQLASDFVIQGENIHGIPGLVNLFGIESPGLTSSLAIAEYLVSKFAG